jgi:hypothetical protein
VKMGLFRLRMGDKHHAEAMVSSKQYIHA